MKNKFLIHKYVNIFASDHEVTAYDITRFASQFWLVIEPYCKYKTPRFRLSLGKHIYTFFFNYREMEEWKQMKDSPFDEHDNDHMYLFSTNSKAQEEVIKFFKWHAGIMRLILDQATIGHPPYIWLRDFFRSDKPKYMDIVEASRWYAAPTLDTSTFDVIPMDAYIEIHGVVMPMARYSNTLDKTNLKYTSKCVECGEYFQCYDKEAQFCSEMCRQKIPQMHKRDDFTPDDV